MFKCDNCNERYEREDQLKHVYPDIPDLLQRLDVGGIVPAGECPACGSLVYPMVDPARVLIVLSGGLVQDVITQTADLQVAVLNMDRDGLDEHDAIVDVVGEGFTLQGVLQAHEPTLDAAAIESAWLPDEQAAP